MGDDLDVVARQSRYAVLELLMKCLERLLLHAVVPVEVGLEAFAHGVALILQGRLRLEYGEVDGGDQSAVRPRLALAIVQKPAAVAGQKQDVMVTLVSTSAMRVRMEGQLLVPLCLNCFMMRNVRFGWFLALSIGA